MYLRYAATLCFYLFGPSSARLHNIVNDAITLTSDQPLSKDMVSNPVGEAWQEIQSVNFPNEINKNPIVLPLYIGEQPLTETSPKTIPVTTEQAVKMGWIKIGDESCNRALGEAWRINGERSRESSLTLYFTPQVKLIPGVVSAIEADYYDHVEKNLVGTYFKPGVVSKLGTYWSIAVLVRKPTKQGLCDTSEHVGIQEEPYIAVAPELVNNVYPTNRNDPEMKKRFVEGVCTPGMGYHWFSDVVGGAKLTYEVKNLNPVTPMYNSVTGEFQAFYFIATDVLKRNWPFEKCGWGLSGPCGFQHGVSNMWDNFGPGLFQKNEYPYTFCGQFCDPDCQFTGAPDFPELGVAPGFNTMHIFLGKNDDDCLDPKGMDKTHYPSDLQLYCRDPYSYPNIMSLPNKP